MVKNVLLEKTWSKYKETIQKRKKEIQNQVFFIKIKTQFIEYKYEFQIPKEGEVINIELNGLF